MILPAASESCPLLEGNMGAFGSPKEFVEYFSKVWRAGSPDGFKADTFTSDVMLADPTGITKGAREAEDTFRALLTTFRGLRGRVSSYSFNERHVVIEWQWLINQYVSPIVDSFCFSEGKVSFRRAYFDTPVLMKYLSEEYGRKKVAWFFSTYRSYDYWLLRLLPL